MSRFALLLTAAAAACLTTAAFAVPTIDPTGDFLPTYTGPKNGDLDVTSVEVINTGTSLIFNSTFAAPIGTTTGGFYVWGLNRGVGAAQFGALAPGVLFDSVLIIRPGGTSNFADLITATNNFTINPAAITVNGSALSVTVALALLPSTGFATGAYTFNLWPRATGPTGIAAISDFAPDNSNIRAVPEPAAWALMLAGFAGVGAALRQRRRAIV